MLNKEEIEKIIPQRDPFLMIDEVEEYVPGESAIAYKYVNEKEWYFKGHFPGNPIMPGVLITEALAQTGAVAILSMEENKGRTTAMRPSPTSSASTISTSTTPSAPNASSCAVPICANSWTRTTLTAL